MDDQTLIDISMSDTKKIWYFKLRLSSKQLFTENCFIPTTYSTTCMYCYQITAVNSPSIYFQFPLTFTGNT